MITTVLCYSATSGSSVADCGKPCRVDMGNVGLTMRFAGWRSSCEIVRVPYPIMTRWCPAPLRPSVSFSVIGVKIWPPASGLGGGHHRRLGAPADGLGRLRRRQWYRAKEPTRQPWSDRMRSSSRWMYPPLKACCGSLSRSWTGWEWCSFSARARVWAQSGTTRSFRGTMIWTWAPCLGCMGSPRSR